MAVFYQTLLYFFIFLCLDTLRYIEIGKSFSQFSVSVLILFILLYMLLSLINIRFNYSKRKYQAKIKLGYPIEPSGYVIVNLGAGILPLGVLIYAYAQTAFIPFLIALSVSLAVCLWLYWSERNIKNKLPAFIIFIISAVCALLLAPANPVFLMLAAFIACNLFLLLTNLFLFRKKTPLSIGDENFYHVFFIVMLIALII